MDTLADFHNKISRILLILRLFFYFYKNSVNFLFKAPERGSEAQEKRNSSPHKAALFRICHTKTVRALDFLTIMLYNRIYHYQQLDFCFCLPSEA